MSEISKHFDLYQFFVYLLPGIFFILVIYFLFLFGFLDIAYYQSLLHPELLPNFANNIVLFSIIWLIIAYFVGHILHLAGIIVFKAISKISKKIRKISKCIKEDNKKDKDTKIETMHEKIKKYVEAKFDFAWDGIEKPDYMLTYLFLEDFIQSKKIKLMQVLLWLYKSLFVISIFVMLIFFVKWYIVYGSIMLLLSICLCRQAENYYLKGWEYTYQLAYLYFKNLKK